MRTTLNIDDQIMRTLLRVTHAHTKTKAVETALEDFLRRRQIEGLRNLRGKLPLRRNWRKMEQIEVKRSHLGHG